MRILARYISGAFTKNFLLSVSILTFLYLFQTLLGQLLDHEFPANQIIYYNLLGLPEIFVQMVPPSILMATVLTLSGFTRTNELTACHSIGVGLRQIVLIIMSIVFMISCFTLMLQDRILPPLFKNRISYYWRDMNKRQDFFLDVKQDKIWYRSKNLIYNLKLFDPISKTIHGMSVYTFDEKFDLVQVIDANRAQFTPSGWKLMDGTVTVFSTEDQFPLTQKFEEKDLVIQETPKDFQEIEKEVDGLRLMELRKYIKKIASTGVNTKSYEVKWQSRISLSFIPLVMCVLAIPFSTRSRRQGGMGKDLGICLGLTFFYWLFYSVSLSLGTNGALPPVVAAWLPSGIFAALAGGLLTVRRS